ncbi:MAG TPA: hypothetical protein VM287_11625 [Egibacteraceae bacterium]|nr:hypothetical protein [Egibacteraceae bacterium]
MTQTINLLPARYAERIAERRAAAVAGVALVALVVLLGLASVVQPRQLAQAESRREAEQARTAQLLAQRRALAPFRQVVDGIVGRERLLAAAMQTQVSWAQLFTSLSTTFPGGASLTSLTAESTLAPFETAPPAKPGDEDRVIGSMTLKGYSVERFAPGVEQILQLLDGVRGLSRPRLQVGTADKIGARPVTTFDAVSLLDAAALTGRYADGLPPERDVEVPALGRGTAAPAGGSAAPPRAAG